MKGVWFCHLKSVKPVNVHGFIINLEICSALCHNDASEKCNLKVFIFLLKGTTYVLALHLQR